MEDAALKQTLETLLFLADQPIPLSKLAKILEEEEPRISGAVEELRKDYEARGGVQILEIGGGFQMSTRPAFAAFVRKLYAEKMTMRLSAAALETLSIVAYKQPITRAEIEEIRGVDVIAALESLLDKRLIKVTGRRESVGRPILYGTTPEFMRHFGLKNLGDLPPIESFQPAEPAAPQILAPEQTTEIAPLAESAEAISTSEPGAEFQAPSPEPEAPDAAEPVAVAPSADAPDSEPQA